MLHRFHKGDQLRIKMMTIQEVDLVYVIWILKKCLRRMNKSTENTSEMMRVYLIELSYMEAY